MKNIVIPTLEADDIEVKIKQVTQKGAFALLYKTARTDMRILDEMFGIGGWQVSYERIGEVLYCTISVWDEDKNQWVHKQNCGIESREDGEGNEKKGEASDAMKRSGFLLGIGRELYSSPRIFLNVETKEDGEYKGKKVYKLSDPWAKYIVTDISYDVKRKITRLVIANEKTGEVVYRYGVSAGKTTKKQEAPKKEEQAQEATKVVPIKREAPKKEEQEQKPSVETSDTIPNDNIPPHQRLYLHFINEHGITGEEFIALRAKAVRAGKEGITAESLKNLAPDEWVKLLAQMEALYSEGFFDKHE